MHSLIITRRKNTAISKETKKKMFSPYWCLLKKILLPYLLIENANEELSFIKSYSDLLLISKE